jgi:hypothetical protein
MAVVFVTGSCRLFREKRQRRSISIFSIVNTKITKKHEFEIIYWYFLVYL